MDFIETIDIQRSVVRLPPSFHPFLELADSV
jgi:hypothetical protein